MQLPGLTNENPLLDLPSFGWRLDGEANGEGCHGPPRLPPWPGGSGMSANIGGCLTVDPAQRRLAGPKGAVFLGEREFAVVQRLAARPGAVVRHNELIAVAFPNPDEEPDFSDVIVRQAICRLRAVLTTLGAGQRPIVSERGVGYRLVAAVA